MSRILRMLLYVMCYMSTSCILRYVTLPGAEEPNASPFGELAEVPSGSEPCRRELLVRSPGQPSPFLLGEGVAGSAAI